MKKKFYLILVTLLVLSGFIGKEIWKTFQYDFSLTGSSITLLIYREDQLIRSFNPSHSKKTKIIVPKTVIGRPVTQMKWTFQNSNRLESVTLPDTIHTLGELTFSQCNKIEHIDLPSKLTWIDNRVFSGCERIKSMELPSGVSSIGEYAFAGCSDLKEIILSDKLEEINRAAFLYCTSLEEVTIPDQTEEIHEIAFQGCTNLKSVYIPASVTTLGEDIFKDCPQVTIITPKGSYAEEYAKRYKIPCETQNDMMTEDEECRIQDEED